MCPCDSQSATEDWARMSVKTILVLALYGCLYSYIVVTGLAVDQIYRIKKVL